MNKKVIVVIRDGWWYKESEKDNAIAQANTPNTDTYMQEYPNTLLDASGSAVGLPDWYMGNSEVGHMTIGSWRIIFQSLARIHKSIHDQSFFKIPEFVEAIQNCKKNWSRLHLIWLLQIQWVHAHIDHLFALLDLCKLHDFHNVYIHVITDGRDAPVTDSQIHMKNLLDKISELWFGEIATITWRYYAMDRDKRWDRTQIAYETIVQWNEYREENCDDPLDALNQLHKDWETDEFIKPLKRNDYEWFKEHDSVIFYNFRTDRPRQLTQAIVEHDFYGFDRVRIHKLFYVSMTEFYRPMNAHVAFKDQNIDNLLGEIVSKAWYKQLRISETEKYAHVTFFFNGQKEKPNENEDRILIDSPKVATYDLQPEMSVPKIDKRLVDEITKEKYDLIVTNLVNGDMVGHTWIPTAIRKWIEAVDTALGDILEAWLAHGYTLIVFADHGNAEDQTPEWRTSHTTNPVQCMIISDEKDFTLKDWKGLQDIAPTVLDILGLDKPKEMTGETLIQ